jgi:impB/mucB/samB family
LGWTAMSKLPELYACVYAKEFPVHALLRLRPDIRSQACVVLEGELPQQTVCSMNPRARVLGAERGMTLVEIETLPPLQMLARARKQEEATRSALLECAGTFSPRVEDRSTDNAFIAVIDIAGTDKLFGTPDKLAALSKHQVLSSEEMRYRRDGEYVRAAGLVIARQRPGTAKGFVFISMEDETGIANLIVTPDLYERERLVVTRSKFILVEGPLQNQDGVIHVKAVRIRSMFDQTLEVCSHDFH